MDLSHWDLVDVFSLHEAACLASGFDPKLKEITPEQDAKAILLRQVMNAAHDSAVRNADMYLLSQFDEDFFFVEKPVERGDLQSIELQKKFHICLRMKKRLGDFQPERPTFSRETLDTWLKEKGYQSPYSFCKLPSQEHEKEKPLTTKERTTLLTLVGLLAEEAKIDISKPSKAASTLVSLAETKGIQIAQRTIEEHLKKIPDALEKRGRTEAYRNCVSR